MEKDTLFSGESVNVEYKVTVPTDSAKCMKTVVANGRGGKTIFGVDDKTLEVVGMNTDSIFQTYALPTGQARLQPVIQCAVLRAKTIMVL